MRVRNNLRYRANVFVAGKYTSVHVENDVWDALVKISRRTGRDQSQLLDGIAAIQVDDQTFASAIRMFVLRFFMAVEGGLDPTMARVLGEMRRDNSKPRGGSPAFRRAVA